MTIAELRRGISLLRQSAKRTELEEFIEITIPLWFGDRVLTVTQSIAEHCAKTRPLLQNAGLWFDDWRTDLQEFGARVGTLVRTKAGRAWLKERRPTAD